MRYEVMMDVVALCQMLVYAGMSERRGWMSMDPLGFLVWRVFSGGVAESLETFSWLSATQMQ